MMTPYYTEPGITIYHGDCIEVMRGMASDSVDSIVTDPPYGLRFMGKAWDYDVPGVEVWREALRVLKPGGHLLAFAGTRTQHRMAVNIEDAGFEIRDMIGWIYGSGFPKSLDIGKAIDKAAGVEREVMGVSPHFSRGRSVDNFGVAGIGTTGQRDRSITAPATEAARQWDGWGTALKPAFEPITMARKPIPGTVAANVLEHGTGGLNVDGCRIDSAVLDSERRTCVPAPGIWGKGKQHPQKQGEERHNPQGRFPANIIHDGSDEVLAVFPETTTGNIKPYEAKSQAEYRQLHVGKITSTFTGDSGSAARFFYQAKTSKAERDAGCEGMEGRKTTFAEGTGLVNNGDGSPRNQARCSHNHHPTVKPIDLMRYLCRLVTPPGGVVLDMFMGSGSTLLAAHEEGFKSIGIEISSEYCEIARARIREATRQQRLDL